MNKLIMLSTFLLVTGCSVTSKSSIASPVSVEAKSKIQGNIDVGEKISGSVKATTFLGFLQLSGPNKYIDGMFIDFNPFDPVPGLKSAAAYVTKVNSGAEIIVNPQYTVIKNSALGFANYEVTVTGYKGVFTEFVNKPID
jgi:hypothetical protein